MPSRGDYRIELAHPINSCPMRERRLIRRMAVELGVSLSKLGLVIGPVVQDCFFS
jgi:hypothetical protein